MPMSATPRSPTKPLHDRIAPPERDPPNKPMHDPPGDPTFEPPQPLTEPTPNPASDPPPETPGDPPQMRGGWRGLPSKHTGGYGTWASPICFSVECRTLPQGSARIDTALALDELVEGLQVRLVCRHVAQGPAPLAPGSFVSPGRVGGAPNDSAERVFPIRHLQPLQAQSPARPVNLPALRRPPGHQAVHGGQVPIDRVPVAAGLGVFPGTAAGSRRVLSQASTGRAGT